MIQNSCDIDWRVWCCWQYFVINKSIIIGDCWCCFKSHGDCLALQQAQDRYSLLPDMLTTSPESSSLASTLITSSDQLNTVLGFIDSTPADTGRCMHADTEVLADFASHHVMQVLTYPEGHWQIQYFLSSPLASTLITSSDQLNTVLGFIDSTPADTGRCMHADTEVLADFASHHVMQVLTYPEGHWQIQYFLSSPLVSSFLFAVVSVPNTGFCFDTNPIFLHVPSFKTLAVAQVCRNIQDTLWFTIPVT